jgi:DNA-binding protein HU-beta
MPAADAVNPEDRMTKNELVEQIADRAGLSKAQAGEALGAVLEAIEQGLARGEDVSITGFGKFTVAHRSARQGVNPATGQPMQIAASRSPRFSAGAKLKDAVKV